MNVAGKSCKAAGGISTKKLTLNEPQSSLRTLVTGASICKPVTSKRSMSPGFTLISFARPCSIEICGVFVSPYQVPAERRLSSGSSVVYDRLNSRSTRRFASSPLNESGLTGLPLMAISRPRTIGASTVPGTPCVLR